MSNETYTIEQAAELFTKARDAAYALDTLRAELVATQTERDNTRQEIGFLYANADALRADLAGMTTARDQAAADLAEARREIERLRKIEADQMLENANLTTKLNEAIAERDTANNVCDTLRLERGQAIAERDELHEKHVDALSTLGLLRTELADAKSDAENWSRSWDQADRERMELHRKLNETKDSINALAAAMTALATGLEPPAPQEVVPTEAVAS